MVATDAGLSCLEDDCTNQCGLKSVVHTTQSHRRSVAQQRRQGGMADTTGGDRRRETWRHYGPIGFRGRIDISGEASRSSEAQSPTLARQHWSRS